jgi:hypothetical protein
MDLEGTGHEDMDYVHLIQIKEQSRDVFNMVMELHTRREISSIAGQQPASQKDLCSMRFSYSFICNAKRINEWKSYVKQGPNINFSWSVF